MIICFSPTGLVSVREKTLRNDLRKRPNQNKELAT